MNRRHAGMAAAFVAGIVVAGTAAYTQEEWTRLPAVMETLLPRQQEAREIVRGDIVFATAETDLQDLPLLVAPEGSNTPGRYQAVALDGIPEFVVLDTQTGLARRFTDAGSVLVYSSHVPNHVLEQGIRKHDAFESVTRRELRTRQP